MAQNPDLSHLPDEWVDERGVTLTRAGVERARQHLAELDATFTPELREARRRAVLADLDAA